MELIILILLNSIQVGKMRKILEMYLRKYRSRENYLLLQLRSGAHQLGDLTTFKEPIRSILKKVLNHHLRDCS
jgi:hypothetical protein